MVESLADPCRRSCRSSRTKRHKNDALTGYPGCRFRRERQSGSRAPPAPVAALERDAIRIRHGWSNGRRSAATPTAPSRPNNSPCHLLTPQSEYAGVDGAPCASDSIGCLLPRARPIVRHRRRICAERLLLAAGDQLGPSRPRQVAHRTVPFGGSVARDSGGSGRGVTSGERVVRGCGRLWARAAATPDLTGLHRLAIGDADTLAPDEGRPAVTYCARTHRKSCNCGNRTSP